MAKDLNEIRDELYIAFNKAMKNAKYPSDVLAFPKHAQAAALSLQAAAATAEAIVKVEQELLQRGETKPKLNRSEGAQP